uniref:Peptidase S1 domain-containing protein n=1 Tax=Strix occidentalis caurina TaxID=311401 RepID=A0A8D0F2J8_STROC
HFCGGSLISNQWVLSQKNRVQAVRMEENTDVKEDSELVRSAALIIYHPRYNSGSLDNAIMLIKMATTMDYSADIQPTALPSSCSGNTLSSGSNFPMVLQCLATPGLSNQKCQEAYPGQITSNMICLMLLNFSLQDDASGPAVCIGKLRGIVSWENECALKGYPSVYPKVCNYVD